MSYEVHLIAQRFCITTDQFVAAWKVLVQKGYGIHRDYRGEHRPRTLVELLDGVGLRAEVDEEGNVQTVAWDSATSGYHIEEFLKEIAPYVRSGSFLKFYDEYEALTVYRFKDGKVSIKSMDFPGEEDEG